MNVLQSQSVSGASSISQWASVAALDGDNSFIDEHNKVFKERRDPGRRYVESGERP